MWGTDHGQKQKVNAYIGMFRVSGLGAHNLVPLNHRNFKKSDGNELIIKLSFIDSANTEVC